MAGHRNEKARKIPTEERRAGRKSKKTEKNSLGERLAGHRNEKERKIPTGERRAGQKIKKARKIPIQEKEELGRKTRKQKTPHRIHLKFNIKNKRRKYYGSICINRSCKWCRRIPCYG